MHVQPKQPSVKGPAEIFTGDVWFDVITRGGAARMQHGGVRVQRGMRGQWRAASNWSWWSIHQRRRRS
jgi:hypothetical protein